MTADDTLTPGVGMIGLGTMGSALCSRLLDTGRRVRGWNRSRHALKLFAERDGFDAADQPISVFDEPVVISMLSQDDAALATFSEEMLASVPTGRIHINMASLSRQGAEELAERHARHGVGYISAPVLGRAPLAAAGTLLIVTSGDPEHLAQVQPILDDLSTQTWNLGADARLACTVKIAVNYSLIHALQAIAESVAIAERNGVDPSELIEILTHTAFAGTAYRGYGPMIAERRYEPVGFAMDLGLKDLALAESAAADAGLSLPTAPLLRDLFEQAVADERLRDLDWSAVAELTRGASPEQ